MTRRARLFAASCVALVLGTCAVALGPVAAAPPNETEDDIRQAFGAPIEGQGATDGQALTFNTLRGAWIPSTSVTSDLGDVDTTGVVNGDILVFIGTEWQDSGTLSFATATPTFSGDLIAIGTVRFDGTDIEGLSGGADGQVLTIQADGSVTPEAIPGAAAETLAVTLAAGNTTGGTGIVVTAGDTISGSAGTLSILADTTNAGTFEVLDLLPGNVGGFQAGQEQIRNTDTDINSNAVITGHNSAVGNTQLWYVGSSSGSNQDITFLNRQNARLFLGTNNANRLTVQANGDVDVTGTFTSAGTLSVNGSGSIDPATGADGDVLTRQADGSWVAETIPTQAAETLAATLTAGNSTGGTGIVVTAGDTISGSAGALAISANTTVTGTFVTTGTATINGSGSIDPNTGADGDVLTRQADGTWVAETIPTQAADTLAATLAAGSVTGGTDLTITAGDAIIGSAGAVAITADTIVTGDLTATGTLDLNGVEIDPSGGADGQVLTVQADGSVQPETIPTQAAEGLTATMAVNGLTGGTDLTVSSGDSVVAAAASSLNLVSDGGTLTLTVGGEVEVLTALPGIIGGFGAGQLLVRSTGALADSSATITGHNSFSGNTQLWFLGSSSSSDQNITFLNRQSAALSLGTNNATRLTIQADGAVNVTGTFTAAGTISIDGVEIEPSGGSTGNSLVQQADGSFQPAVATAVLDGILNTTTGQLQWETGSGAIVHALSATDVDLQLGGIASRSVRLSGAAVRIAETPGDFDTTELRIAVTGVGGNPAIRAFTSGAGTTNLDLVVQNVGVVRIIDDNGTTMHTLRVADIELSATDAGTLTTLGQDGDGGLTVSGSLAVGGDIELASGAALVAAAGVNTRIEAVSGQVVDVVGNLVIANPAEAAGDTFTIAVTTFDVNITSQAGALNLISTGAQDITIDTSGAGDFRSISNDWGFFVGGGLELANDQGVDWSSTASHAGSKDVGLERQAAGILEVTDGSTGQGALSTLRVVESQTGDDTLTAVESWKLFDNQGAGGSSLLTLPAVANGLTFTVFQAITGGTIGLDPPAGSAFVRTMAGQMDDGEWLSTAAHGESFTVTCSGTLWLVAADGGSALAEETP